MECVFLGLDTRKCSLRLGCAGIHHLILELGGTSGFAQNYSNFILKWLITTRILDLAHDPPKNFIHLVLKRIAQIISVVLPLIVHDIFGIKHKLKEIGDQVNILEKIGHLTDPMDYFRKVGEGYAMAFHYAAIGARCDRNNREKVTVLGEKIGILISLRDAIQDLHEDRLSGSFNPFRNWKKLEILQYYKIQAPILIDKIKQLIQDKSPESILLSTTESKSAIKMSLLKYVSLAAVPYSTCNTIHRTLLLQSNFCYKNYEIIAMVVCLVSCFAICVGCGIFLEKKCKAASSPYDMTQHPKCCPNYYMCRNCIECCT